MVEFVPSPRHARLSRAVTDSQQEKNKRQRAMAGGDDEATSGVSAATLLWIRSCPKFDLWTAASVGAVGGLSRGLDANTNPIARRRLANQRNKDGWTALMYAALYNRNEVLTALIDRGAEVDASSAAGRTRRPNSTEIGESDAGGRGHNCTALTIAASCGKTATVELLLEKGASLEKADGEGLTPLLRAVQFNHMDTTKLLLDRGALVAGRGRFNAFHLACRDGLENIAELLLKYGGLEFLEARSAGPTGLTPEEMARNNGHNKLVQLIHDKKKEMKANRNVVTELRMAMTPAGNAEEAQSRRETNGVEQRSVTSNKKNKQQEDEQSANTTLLTVAADTTLLGVEETAFESSLDHFLGQMGLAKYRQFFHEQEVEMEQFYLMTEEDLKEIGIDKFGPRKKMMDAIRKQQMRTGAYYRVMGERTSESASSSFVNVQHGASNATMLINEARRADTAIQQIHERQYELDNAYAHMHSLEEKVRALHKRVAVMNSVKREATPLASAVRDAARVGLRQAGLPPSTPIARTLLRIVDDAEKILLHLATLHEPPPRATT